MTAQPRDVAEVLAKHQQAYDSTGGYRGILGGWKVRCACGWHGVDHGEGGPRLIFQHQAAMLTAEGYPVTAAGLAQVKAAAWDAARQKVRDAHPGCTDMCDLCIARDEVLDDLSDNPYRTGGEDRG